MTLPLRRSIATAAGLLALAVPTAGATAAESAKPWHAPATVAIDVQELSFSNGGAELSGTLYTPRGMAGLPAVVVTHGASSATRDLPLYRHLTEMLPPLGMAVFVYDRRGSGKSGGDLKASDYDLLADDAIAAQRRLAEDPRIDPRRIGFWGLSQGGWLALHAAARNPEAAFAISVSAPMVTPDVQMSFATESILRIRGYGDADVETALKARRAVDAHLRGELDTATAQKALDAAVDQPWFPLIYMSRTLGDPRTSRWLKEMRHDPLKALDTLKAPALLLYGSTDPWIPTAVSMERLEVATKGRPEIKAVIVDGADHAMMVSASDEEQIDPAFFAGQAPDAPAYFGLLSAWLADQGLAKLPGR